MTVARRWAPLAAFVTLVAGWLVANALAVRASAATLVRANEIFRAAYGHVASSSSDDGGFLLPYLIHGLLPAVGAAALALALKASLRGPWFLAAAAVPFLVTGTYTSHGWFRPGLGIDAYTAGAGFGSADLDLTTYGAGPSWLLWAGTALTVAIVVVPAALLRAPAPAAVRLAAVGRSVLAILPYAALIGVATLTFLGVRGATNSGGDQPTIMLIGGLAVAGAVLVATVLLAITAGWSRLAVAGAAVLVAAAATSPNAQLSTQLFFALASAAAVAIAYWASRRPAARRARPRDERVALLGQ